jgi:hypothetical protein
VLFLSLQGSLLDLTGVGAVASSAAIYHVAVGHGCQLHTDLFDAFSFVSARRDFIVF